MAAITLKGVSSRGFPTAGIHLAIANRAFVVLTGPDQPGPSAIVRLIAGLDAITGGEILFDDRRLNDVPPAERNVALVARGFVPYPRLSVYENVSLGLELRKFGKGEAERRIQEAAEFFELRELLEARPGDLSPEQCQIVALARAAVQQPKVYLLDDPFAGLTANGRRRCRALFAKLRQRSAATIVYATSDGAEALALGGRTVFMESGVIRQDAEGPLMLTSPANVTIAQFFGDPPMNLIHGTLRIDRQGLVFSEAGEGTIAVRLPEPALRGGDEVNGRAVIVGIRPEDLEVSEAGAQRGASFRALVSRVEPKGSESELYLQTGGHDLVCRSRSWQADGEGGRRAEFAINVEKVHLFDPVSGYRITAET
ncbi:MAG TPA: ABC transporter ATP-binding protein [Chthoniobacterales bacterium]|nr:ABC transporter ATP-binding protein [Chthoniobacterales bacterium]